MNLLERLGERWERMDGASATKINRILQERREAAAEIRRLRAVLKDIADAPGAPDSGQPDDHDWRVVALELQRVAAINLT